MVLSKISLNLGIKCFMRHNDEIRIQSYCEAEGENIRSKKVSEILGKMPTSLWYWSLITLMISVIILLVLIIILPIPIELISKIQNFIYHN